MSVLKDLIAYQETDKKLYAIKAEIAQSEERKKYIQAKKFLEGALEKLENYDNKASELKGSAQRMTRKYLEMAGTLKELSGVDDLMENGGDVSFYKKNALSLSDNMKALKSEINNLIAAINSTTEEYQKLKKQTIQMQKQFQEYKEKYSAVKDSRKDEVSQLESELEKLEKNIQPDIMAKYKAKRKENIFPVLCAVKNNRCSVCGMDFPLSLQGDLQSGKVIECENCHRFIYTE